MLKGGGLAQWNLGHRTTDQGVPGSSPGRGAVHCGIEQVTFTPCFVLVKARQEAVDLRPTWTDCDEARDYVLPNIIENACHLSKSPIKLYRNYKVHVHNLHPDGNLHTGANKFARSKFANS